MKLIFIDNNSKRNINEYIISNRFNNKNIMNFMELMKLKKMNQIVLLWNMQNLEI